MTVFSKPEAGNGSTARRRLIPPIPLERPAKKDLQRGEYQTYKLRNNPSEENSPVYELSVPYFCTGTCKEWLLFRRNLDKVITGQNVTGGPGRFTVARRLLEGDALTAFNNAAAGHTTSAGNPSETTNTFSACLDAVSASVFPRRALLLQKRYMRRFVRKPPTMTTRDYVARISEMNSYLPLFPPVTAGTTPEKLPDDEIVDLLEFGVPNSWQKAMILQDFDPLQKTVREFIQFCERLEQVEHTDGSVPVKNPPKKGGTNAKKRTHDSKSKGESTPKDGKNCLLHGDNCGHSTDQCYTLKAQAKKMKMTYDSQAPEKKKAYEQKQELNALVAAAVENAINNAQTAKLYDSTKSGTKRKSELNAFSKMTISSDSDEESNTTNLLEN